MKKPLAPENPCFSSGPTAKFHGWPLVFPEVIKEHAALGRSHRSGVCKSLLQEVIDLNREILGIPDDYLVGILPASDTGAFETALWNLITPYDEIECYYCGSFGKGWYNDLKNQLDVQVKGFSAPYGKLFELKKVKKHIDIVTVWNETTSGVRMPHADWITDDHIGLVFVDATSALFAMRFPWEKADVVSWSPQKCLGSEAAFGMLALSPKAVARLEQEKPEWPLAKIMNLRKGDKLLTGPFEASTINTVSMISVIDFHLSLKWAQKIGLRFLIEKVYGNYLIIRKWLESVKWLDFLVEDEDLRSPTSVTLKIVDKRLKSDEEVKEKVNALAKLLEQEKMAYDIEAYRDAPAGLRIWCGPTVQSINVSRLTKCLDWGWQQVNSQ